MTQVHSRPLDTSVLAFSSFLSRITGKHSKYNGLLKYVLIIAGMLIPGGIGLVSYLRFKRKLVKQTKQQPKSGLMVSAAANKRMGSGGLDAQFFGRLKMLLSIVVPSYRSIEFVQLVALAAIVICRTLVSNKLSMISGDVSKTLLELDFRGFIYHLGASSALSFASALLAPSLKYLINKLALEWRTTLTKYVHKKYLTNLMYYKTSNLSTEVPNPDQVLTQDIQKFCDGMTGLYANLLKPISDLILYTWKLIEIAGVGAPAIILGYMVFSFVFITFIRPPFSALTSRSQNLEGEFRYCHVRTATNGESIAFYGGDELEKNIVDDSFMRLYGHKRSVHKAQLFFSMFNDFFVFNLPGSISWLITMMPVFFGGLKNKSRGEMGGMLRYLGAVISHEFQAIGEMVQLNTRLTQIAGYTNNVCQLLDLIDDIDRKDKEKKNGKFVPGETIRFEGVTLTTPRGAILASDVNFEVKPGKNLLVTGPNGSGKSSLFRVLGGLWPSQEGTIYKPGAGEQELNRDSYSAIYYVPQKPYNSVGTLREQIIYPMSIDQAKNMNDDEMMALLRRVRIDYLVEREGGFDTKRNWDDILSLGEQQRLSMARLFYHQPKYAILDECTSAVSVDIEKRLYQMARELGVTCITISLRPALRQLHAYEFAFDGDGGWKLIKLHDDDDDDGEVEEQENNEEIEKE